MDGRPRLRRSRMGMNGKEADAITLCIFPSFTSNTPFCTTPFLPFSFRCLSIRHSNPNSIQPWRPHTHPSSTPLPHRSLRRRLGPGIVFHVRSGSHPGGWYLLTNPLHRSCSVLVRTMTVSYGLLPVPASGIVSGFSGRRQRER